MKRIIFFWGIIIYFCSCVTAQQENIQSSQLDKFKPGQVWLDTSGKAIQAHGGGIIFQDDTCYWYGEDRTPGQRTSVSCYSSKDLYNWKFEGTAFKQTDLAEDIRRNTFIERPKVIYNAKTKKYVLWMHLEQGGYHFASAGIAISDKPMGPFEFVRYVRPVKYEFDFPEPDPDRQKEFGGTFRDMNLFVDEDGAAYVFYASEHNATLYIVRLNNEYTAPMEPLVEDVTWSRQLVGKYREAPAPFKYKNKYYLISSGCTGWTPNTADLASADKILGPWQAKGNPCIGEEAELTFRTQSTCVLPVAGKTGCFIYMGDRWNPRQLSDSRYIWLPFKFDDEGNIEIKWLDEWDLSYFDKEKETGWKLLFNGNDLSGWHSFKRDDVRPGWQVKDGALVCADPHNAGDLCTNDKYDWFELQLEYNITEAGNSGIMYHVTDQGNATWQTGPEFQLEDNKKAADEIRCGWLYGLYQPPIDPDTGKTLDATKPVGQWNKITLLITPEKCEHRINGVKYFEYVLGSEDFKKRVAGSKFGRMPLFAKSDTGYIALQGDHGQISFRNIKIRTIKTNP